MKRLEVRAQVRGVKELTAVGAIFSRFGKERCWQCCQLQEALPRSRLGTWRWQCLIWGGRLNARDLYGLEANPYFHDQING